MARFRFSIAGLMAFVVLAAVVLASLHEPTPLWSQARFSLAVAVNGVALLGLILCRGLRRATWMGFFVFGAGYLALGFAPGFNASTEPWLLASTLADDHYRGLNYAPSRVGERVWVAFGDAFRECEVFEILPDGSGMHVAIVHGGTARVGVSQVRPLSPDGYRGLCHADLSLLLGFLGAMSARFFDEGSRAVAGGEGEGRR